MTWIQTVPFNEATGELRKFFENDQHKNGYVQHILQALSLRPEALITLTTFRTTFAGDRSLLGRRKEELIHTVVSLTNGSRHCTNSHGEKLHKQDGDLAEQVLRDWRRAPLTVDEQAMLEFCEKLTRRADPMCQEDVDRLRAAGFSDDEILEIVLHVGYRLFMNAVADALGVEDEPG